MGFFFFFYNTTWAIRFHGSFARYIYTMRFLHFGRTEVLLKYYVKNVSIFPCFTVGKVRMFCPTTFYSRRFVFSFLHFVPDGFSLKPNLAGFPFVFGFFFSIATINSFDISKNTYINRPDFPPTTSDLVPRCEKRPDFSFRQL